ncbi:hypothetical protein [Cupriavidus pauculus]|uniref:hypothetical protein n=1 Tax=Cupriavidus pauculus TaxID=82633 RepID=UPI0012FD5E4B|nr:hypothetical protein [Cupriavidus pauculus]MBY4730447.1 hypothetical protein [Cupriavidus pauculus]
MGIGLETRAHALTREEKRSVNLLASVATAITRDQLLYRIIAIRVPLMRGRVWKVHGALPRAAELHRLAVTQATDEKQRTEKSLIQAVATLAFKAEAIRFDKSAAPEPAMTPVLRPDKLTAKQKMILKSLRDGHRASLQFSAVTGEFTGSVRVFDTAAARYVQVPWYRIAALVDRGLVRLDGTSIATSHYVVRVARQPR